MALTALVALAILSVAVLALAVVTMTVLSLHVTVAVVLPWQRKILLKVSNKFVVFFTYSVMVWDGSMFDAVYEPHITSINGLLILSYFLQIILTCSSDRSSRSPSQYSSTQHLDHGAWRSSSPDDGLRRNWKWRDEPSETFTLQTLKLCRKQTVSNRPNWAGGSSLLVFWRVTFRLGDLSPALLYLFQSDFLTLDWLDSWIMLTSKTLTL